MSEYERDYKNQIYSDFAFRLGKIANQYDGTEHPNGKYEVTLYICILQNLLTNCLDGVLRSEENKNRPSLLKIKPLLERVVDENNNSLGLKLSFVKKNTFDETLGSLKVADIIERMRHSLSHPAQIDINQEYPSSGYTTKPDKTENISEVCFINSPDVRKNRPKLFSKEDIDKFIKDSGLGKRSVVAKKVKCGCYCLSKDEKPFARIFRIDLPVDNLKTLITELSDNLSAELKEKNSNR